MNLPTRLLLTLGVLLVGCGSPLGFSQTAAAQYLSTPDREIGAQPQTTRQRRSADQPRTTSPNRDQGVGSVPDWAGADSSPSYGNRSSPSTRSISPNATPNDAPNFPSDPEKAPIGPTGWLVVFGLGYGIFRLRDSP